MTISIDPYALVVGDDVMILLTACDILEDAGFRYHQADNGDEALVLLDSEGHTITRLLTEVEMPAQSTASSSLGALRNDGRKSRS